MQFFAKIYSRSILENNICVHNSNSSALNDKSFQALIFLWCGKHNSDLIILKYNIQDMRNNNPSGAGVWSSNCHLVEYNSLLPADEVLEMFQHVAVHYMVSRWSRHQRATKCILTGENSILLSLCLSVCLLFVCTVRKEESENEFLRPLNY